MLKRVLIIAMLMITWTSLCFAEEVIYSSNSETKILITAKTVNDHDNIIKAKIKTTVANYDKYSIETWIIKSTTRKVVLYAREWYDGNGKFLTSSEPQYPINPPEEAVSKIIDYVDKEGK